jgi:hypothetical protein
MQWNHASAEKLLFALHSLFGVAHRHADETVELSDLGGAAGLRRKRIGVLVDERVDQRLDGDHRRFGRRRGVGGRGHSAFGVCAILKLGHGSPHEREGSRRRHRTGNAPGQQARSRHHVPMLGGVPRLCDHRRYAGMESRRRLDGPDRITNAGSTRSCEPYPCSTRFAFIDVQLQSQRLAGLQLTVHEGAETSLKFATHCVRHRLTPCLRTRYASKSTVLASLSLSLT